MVDSYMENRELGMLLNKKHVSSKAKCFWKDCTNRVHPDQLFCSKSCHNKSYTCTTMSRMHQMSMKFWFPDQAWFNAPQLDGGLWYSTVNPVALKHHKHNSWWMECFGTMWQRYGVAKSIPPIKRTPDAIDQALRTTVSAAPVAPFHLTSWNGRNQGALSWPKIRRPQ